MKKIFLLTFLFLAACAPKVEERTYPDPKRDFNPRLEDTDLRSKFPEIYRFDFDASTYWNGDTKWGSFYRQVEHLLIIGKAMNEPKLVELAKNLLEKSRAMTKNFSVIDLGNSPFAELAISRTEQDTKTALAQADKDLQEGAIKVIAVLDRVSKNKQWPTTPMEIELVGLEVEKFLILFRDEALKTDAFEPLKTELKKEIDVQILWAKNVTKELGTVARSATTLSNFINPVNAILEREKIEIDAELRNTLTQGKTLASSLLQCTPKDPQTALRVIVDVWVLLDDKEREQYIKPVNEDLYKYLKGKNDKDLNCLKKDNCNGIFRDMIKNLFVLPKIEKYGVAKLCNEVNTQSLDFGRKALQEAGPEILVTVPQIIRESLDEAVAENRAKLKEIQTDYKGFVKTRVSDWSKVQFKDQPLGFEPDRMQVSVQKREVIFQPSHTGQNTTPEGIGAGMSLYKLLWDLEPGQDAQSKEYLLRTGAEQINRLVALGGYRDSSNNLVPAFLMPIEENGTLLELEKITEVDFSYAVPEDVFFDKNMRPGLERPKDDSSRNYAARSQAELIRGLSSMIEFFQDWNLTSYEKSLSAISAQDLVPDFQTEELNTPVFPKGDLLAMSVAEAATLLQKITKERSQVFLVDLQNQIQWASDYDFENGETAVMAGIVDINRNNRSKSVKADDVSRMIISLSKFLNATKDISQTKSELLLKKDSFGKSPVDTLLDARQQIKLLVVGLTNIVSHQFVTKEYSVARSLRLETLNPDETEERSILDQALAIRAMLAASEVTGIDIYRLSAIDLYYAMNQKFYNPKMRFYSVSERTETLPLPIVLETIAALSELKPYLPEAGQEQLTWVLKPWIDGLKNLH